MLHELQIYNTVMWILASVQRELSVARALGGTRQSPSAPTNTVSLLAFITAIGCIPPTFLFNKCFNFSKKKKTKQISLKERGKGEPRLFFVLRKLSVFLCGDESFCVFTL